MADTSIEWTDKVWNPVRGCALVSAGCTNCYAMKQAHRFASKPEQPYWGLTKMTSHGPVWNGNITMAPNLLGEPLRWRKPTRVFVNSMSDLFHEGVPESFIQQVFAIMAAAPRHTFQVLTKRPERMAQMLADQDLRWIVDGCLKLVKDGVIPDQAFDMEWPLPNVWLGVSVENQAAADERIPLLLKTPAAVRWISAEPLLGPLRFRWAPYHHQATGETYREYLERNRSVGEFESLVGINWVVAGGESGPGARPMQSDWARSLRDQCAAAGVPFFFKQWGDWVSQNAGPQDVALGGCRSRDVFENGQLVDGMFRVGKRAAGRLLDGVEHSEYPA